MRSSCRNALLSASTSAAVFAWDCINMGRLTTTPCNCFGSTYKCRPSSMRTQSPKDSPFELTTSNRTPELRCACAYSCNTPAESTLCRSCFVAEPWAIEGPGSLRSSSPGVFSAICVRRAGKPGAPMRCSVSRAVADAVRDPEWPGPDPRRWTQTVLAPLPAKLTEPGDAAPREDCILRRRDGPLLAPLSPSLRMRELRPSSLWVQTSLHDTLRTEPRVRAEVTETGPLGPLGD